MKRSRETPPNLAAQLFEKLFIIIVILVVWETVSRLGWVDPFLLPSFSKIMRTLFNITLSGELLTHLGVSLWRIFVGFSIAVALGIPLGVGMGWFVKVDRMLDTLFQILRNTSVLAMFPVFILFFGLGETSKIAIIFWGALWPTLINTISGVQHIDPLLIKGARCMGVKGITLFRKVILPATVPSLITGLRLSASMSMIIMVAAEMVGANRGIGFYIYWEQQKYEAAPMYAAIIAIALVGYVINYLLVSLENSLTVWKGSKDE